MRMRSRPENSWPNSPNNGAVRRMSHEIENRRAIRMNIARNSPSLRARGCCARGSLPARIEMKITLSTPRTISSDVSVTRAIQVCGFVSHSIMMSGPTRDTPAG